MIDTQLEEHNYRLGKSSYYLTFVKEELGLVSGYKLIIANNSKRSKRDSGIVPIIVSTPRKPILTLVLDGQTYPLFIKTWLNPKANRFIIGGDRSIPNSAQITWSCQFDVAGSKDNIQLGMQIAAEITPNSRANALVTLSLPIIAGNVLASGSELASARKDIATVVWDAATKFAVSLISPNTVLDGDAFTDTGELTATFAMRSGKAIKAHSWLAIGKALDGPSAKAMVLDHYAQTCPSIGPKSMQWAQSLMDSAAHAAVSYTDKGAYDICGMEKSYLRAPESSEQITELDNAYYSGFPYYPVDAARALIEWRKLTADDMIGNVALMAARGVAADFPAIVDTGKTQCNKGAFWDMLRLQPEDEPALRSSFDNQPSLTLLTNARVAKALFALHSREPETLFVNMAMNACHWMLLRQNSKGYFDGDRYNVSRKWNNKIASAGIETIPAFVEAFRHSRNEVYIRAAWKVANFAIDEILPHHPTPTILPTDRIQAIDSPLALAAVIRAFILLDAEAPNKKLRAAIHMAGNRLICYPYDDLDTEEFNYDGQWSGLWECAQALFWLYALERNPAQLKLALALTKAIPASGQNNWRIIDAYRTQLMAIACLIKEATVNFEKTAVKLSWRTFEPEEATRQYLTIQAANGITPVEHLELVCRGDDTALILVLTPQDVKSIHIGRSGRYPAVKDLTNGTLVDGDIPTHCMPFTSKLRFGVYELYR